MHRDCRDFNGAYVYLQSSRISLLPTPNAGRNKAFQCFSFKKADIGRNKTGLQPVSRPVEQILGFLLKGFKKGSFSKSYI